MSLRVDDRSGRSRSKSPGRERSRSRSNVRAPKAPSPPPSTNYGYAAPTAMSPSSTMPGGYGNGVTSPAYEVRSPTFGGAERSGYFGNASTSAQQAYYPPPPPHPPPQNAPYPPQDDAGFTMGDYKDFPPHERPGYVPPAGQFPPAQRRDDDGLAYGEPNSAHNSRQASHSGYYPGQSPQSPYPPQQPQRQGSVTSPTYQYTPQSANSDPRSSSYTYQYAQAPDKITYTTKPHTGGHSAQYTETPQGQYRGQLPRSYSQDAYDHNAQVVDITPGHDMRARKSSSSKSHSLSVSSGQPGLQPQPSPGLTSHLGRLSVSGNRPDMSALGGGGLPPPSPLLEAYHGTYQQISPMPLAIRDRDDDDSDLDDLEPLSPTLSRTSDRGRDKLAREAQKEKDKKRVKLYDGEEDAKRINKALSHHKIDGEAICEVLPHLSHDQIMELRKEYKKQVKIQGKGVNLSKHLKTKLTGNFGKVAYVTALGKFESEGYWANFFYQSHGSRRELLIESLMGRTNADIWNIKDEFKDKRYSDSLVKCMEKELKMDKFRAAVLMVLEERRQEEQDVYPIEYRNRDVDTLHKALTAKQGGESAMLEIIVRRSDAHLREVLKTYERMYQENFPRAALKKSNNLVGEVIAHILNGVINKPARDALLLRHAIKDIAEKNKDDDLRYELLISRVVRLHWDKMHLMRVQREYLSRYKKELEQDIEDACRGDFAEFMIDLCQVKQ